MATNSSSAAHKFRLRWNDWLVPPMATITFGCCYRLFVSFSSFEKSDLNLPSLAVFTIPALLIALFGALYVYWTISRRYIDATAHVIAYLFSFTAIIALVYILSKSGTCVGFFGVRESCTSSAQFTVSYLVFNPVTLIICAFLAVCGLFSLLFFKYRDDRDEL